MPPLANYRLVVKTGDRRGAGTDANVTVILHCDDGRQTKKHWLWHVFKNDFERGNTDKFSVESPPLTSVDTLELWRNSCPLGGAWYVETVEVQCEDRKCNYVFPIFRWIRPNYHYYIRHLDTSLPQNDPHQQQRELDLQQKKNNYEMFVKVPGCTAGVTISLT